MINIKAVSIDDLDLLQEIGKQTFRETFLESNSEENLNNYLKEGFSTEKLLKELNEKNSLFYFATIDNKPVGYLKLNFGSSQTELKNNESLEIERIYVLNEFQGKKIGQILFEKATDVAKNKHLKYVWLGVWEKNFKAIDFYKKNGFIEFDKHIFKLGDEEQIDIMMKLELNF